MRSHWVARGVAAAVVAVVLGTAAPAQASLAGAWSFDEPAGTTALDSSGHGNHGVVAGARRIAAGRYGRALAFDGIDDLVTVADVPSLGATGGMTLEAWVRPAAFVGTWRTVLINEQPGGLACALYAGQDTGRPSGHAFVGGEAGLAGPSRLPLNTWSHLAVTYDGAALRLYVDGAQVAAAALGGPLAASASPLRIGGNAVWGEWFSGLIDEVRVHDRALTPTEIAADHDTPIAAVGVLARRGKSRTSRGARQPVRLLGSVYGQRRPQAEPRARPRAHRPRWLRARG